MATLYESYETGQNTLTTAETALQWRGQAFTPSVNHTLSSVKLYLKHNGSAPDSVIVEIYATSGGYPTGSAISTGTIAGGDLTSSLAWYDVTMTPVNLYAGLTYAVIHRIPNSNGRLDYGVTNPGGYAGGYGQYSDDSGSSWAAAQAWDGYFEEWGDELEMTEQLKTLYPPPRLLGPYRKILFTSLDLQNDEVIIEFPEISQIPQVWSLVELRFNGTMTAAAANRQLIAYKRTLFGGTSQIFMMGWHTQVITASQSGALILSPTGVITGGSVSLGLNVNDHFEIPPDSVVFSGEDTLRLLGTNGQAGDLGNVYAVFKHLNRYLEMR